MGLYSNFTGTISVYKDKFAADFIRINPETPHNIDAESMVSFMFAEYAGINIDASGGFISSDGIEEFKLLAEHQEMSDLADSIANIVRIYGSAIDFLDIFIRGEDPEDLSIIRFENGKLTKANAHVTYDFKTVEF